MKTLIFLVATFIFQFPCLGQEKPVENVDCDCLRPLGSPFGMNRYDTENIQKNLFNGISDVQLIHYRTSRSVLAIEIDTTDNSFMEKFNIVYNLANSRISRLPKKNEKIEVETTRKSISKEDARKVERLFSAALSNVEAPRQFGMDGCTYYFANMLEAGKAWTGCNNKDGKTKIHKLIVICNELRDQMRTANKQFEIDHSMSIRIENLKKEFIDQRNANNH